MFTVGKKRLDLLKDGVLLCSPYEFLFPTMGMGYQGANGAPRHPPYHFARLPNLDIHKGKVLLDENTVFIDVPASMTVKNLKQMVEVDMYKEKIDPDDPENPLASADVANNPIEQTLNVVDNPLGMVRFFDVLRDDNFGDDITLKKIDQYAGTTPWFGDTFASGIIKSKNDIEKYNYGFCKNVLPFHFILGCGYRTLLLNMHLFKLAYRSDDGGNSRIATNTLIPPEVSFGEDRLKKILSSIDALSSHWKFSSWDEVKKPQYYYVSTFDSENKNSIINAPSITLKQMETISSKGSLGLGNMVFSKKFHPYADILTRAIYDTYVSFGCTHSITDYYLQSYNKVDPLKVVVGMGFTNMRMYTYQIQNDRIRFPNENRLFINGAGSSKNTVRALDSLRSELKDMESLLNDYRFLNEVSVASTILNAKEQQSEMDDNDISFFSGFTQSNNINTRSYPPMNDGLNEKIGKYIRSPIFLDEVLQEFNAADPQDVEKINLLLKGYAKTPGFVVVRTKDLFNQDCVDHCMGVNGIFGQESEYDDMSLSQDYGSKPTPDYLALPFFFFQHLLRAGMFSTINIVFIANFIKSLKIPEKGNVTSFKKTGLNIMADISNFALTPFISLYERMYSVLYHDRIFKFIKERARQNKSEITMFMNHAAKEFLLFTNQDTFANLGTDLYMDLSLIDDREYKGKVEFMPYTLLPGYPVGATEKEAESPFVFMADNALDEEGDVKMDDLAGKKIKGSYQKAPENATAIINRLEFMIDGAVKEWLNYNGGRVDYSEEKKNFARMNAMRKVETDMEAQDKE